MRRVFFALVLIALVANACGAPQAIERRGAVKYSAEDWAHSDARHTVDIQAQPVGGMKAFLSRLDYPVALRQQNVTGVVNVRVSLDATGHLLSVQIIQSVHPTLDDIVLRAIRQTQWKPAMKGGRAVPYVFRFPVTFSRHA